MIYIVMWIMFNEQVVISTGICWIWMVFEWVFTSVTCMIATKMLTVLTVLFISKKITILS